MPPVQTSVSVSPARGQAGTLYDASLMRDVVSKVAQTSGGAKIPFGSWVKIADENCQLPASAGDVTSGRGGIVLRSDAVPSDSGGYSDGDVVPVLVFGRCFVTTEGSVSQFAQAYVRHTDGQQGAIRQDVDGGDASAAPGLQFYEAASAGLVVVSVGMVGATGATGPTGPQGPTGP